MEAKGSILDDELFVFLKENDIESHRNFVIQINDIIHCFTDEILRKVLVREAAIPYDLHGQVKLLYSLGVLSAFDKNELYILNGVRNKFAHNYKLKDISPEFFEGSKLFKSIDEGIRASAENFISKKPEMKGKITDALIFESILRTYAYDIIFVMKDIRDNKLVKLKACEKRDVKDYLGHMDDWNKLMGSAKRINI
ncbi:MAG: hypothetical protein N4A47_03425 [Clostridia bacterium]|jgi:hypothetical protein|nr:hypothetical protein [Clostridia bacterium]